MIVGECLQHLLLTDGKQLHGSLNFGCWKGGDLPGDPSSAGDESPAGCRATATGGGRAGDGTAGAGFPKPNTLLMAAAMPLLPLRGRSAARGGVNSSGGMSGANDTSAASP